MEAYQERGLREGGEMEKFCISDMGNLPHHIFMENAGSKRGLLKVPQKKSFIGLPIRLLLTNTPKFMCKSCS